MMEVRGGKDPGTKKDVDYPRNEQFERIDVNNLVEMREILEISKHPSNMKHLAGISQGTEISDIIAHYKKTPQERDGRAMLERGHVVGIFEVSPFDPSRLGNPSDEYPSWEIKSAILNRVAIRSDEQAKGKGTRLVAYAEEVAFREHDYSTLVAAIILDLKQKKAYDKAFKVGKVNAFVQDYANNDARGKLYLRNSKWNISGVLRDQGGLREGELNHVLLIQKTKKDWEKNRNNFKEKALPSSRSN
jgi:GNAT superfamily N-acetyltransferase